MKAYILDDELSSIEVMEIYLHKHFPEITIIGKNTKPINAIAEIDVLQPNLLFLDVQMPKLNGFEVSEQLNKPWPMVVFTTAYDKFAIDAIRFSALYYLLKPLNLPELKNAIEKATENLISNQDHLRLQKLLFNMKAQTGQKPKIAIKNNDAIDYLSVDEIIRCEADNNYTKIYLSSGEKIIVSKTLKTFELVLVQYNFLRIHQSHLINQEYLKRYHKTDGGFVTLADGTELPVARARKDILSNKIDF